MAVLQPFDLELAAIDDDDRLALAEPAPRRRDQGRAGARAAGERDAGAALPHPKADAAPVDPLGDADIGALGKQRMVLQHRPQALEIDALGVVDEEHRVRIAHAYPRRLLQ